MNSLEQQLLRSEIGEAEVRLCIRSSTYVDTGRWWWRSPLWLCVTDDTLLMLAVARRQFLARVSLRNAHASRYHHASGELVIEPAESLPLNRIKLPIHDALHILQFVHRFRNSTSTISLHN